MDRLLKIKNLFYEIPVNIRVTFRQIFIFGLLCSLYQICLIREITAIYASSGLTFSASLVINLTIAGFGIGAILCRPLLKKDVFSKLAIFSGISIIAVLIYILRILPTQPQTSLTNLGVLFKTSTLISPPLIIFGMIFTHLTAKIISFEKTLVGRFICCGILGTALGYLFAPKLTTIFGVHTLLVLIGFSAIFQSFSRRFFIIIVPVTALFLLILPMEQKLDNLWLAKPHLAPLNLSNLNLQKIYSGWSPYHKIDFYKYGKNNLVAFYDLQRHWQLGNEGFYIKSYSKLINSNSNVLLIGTGGGAGVIDAWQCNPRRLTAVEIDPLIVRLLKGPYSKYNNNIYNTVPVFAEDGRAFLENSKEKYDLISLEGILGISARVNNRPTSIENYMYTKEGLEVICQHLTEEGVLFIGSSVDLKEISRLYQTLQGIDMHVETFEFYWRPHFFEEGPERIIIASRNHGKLKYFLNNWQDTPSFKIITDQMQQVSIVTDNRPFFYLYDLKMIRPFLSIIFVLCTAALLVIIESKRRKWIAYFFLIGIGFILTEYFITAMFRSFFLDPISTIAIITAILLSCAALGSLYSDKLDIQKTHQKYLLIFLTVLIWLLFCIQNIPFSNTSWFLKSIFALVTIMPFAFTIGIFFPLGLRKIGDRGVPLAYFFDTLGTSLGLFLFCVISIKFGFLTNFYVLGGAYLISILLLYKVD